MPVGFVEERGCRIMLEDFSGLGSNPATLAEIDAVRQFVGKLPRRKDLLVLVDVSRMRFDDEVLTAFRELIRHNEPWEHAVAVFGLRGVGLVAFRANNLLTGGRLHGFKEREEAVEWLVKQAKPAAE